MAAQGPALVDEVAEEAEEAPDKARGAEVVDDQIGETDAISAAEATCTYPADEWGAEENTDVANDWVSTNFNRGHDHVATLAQQGQISLSPNLILLYLCSMCSVCNDSSLLHNMQHFKERSLSQGLRIVSNEGTMDCDQVGSISALLCPVWYNADSIANILLMSEVAQD